MLCKIYPESAAITRINVFPGWVAAKDPLEVGDLGLMAVERVGNTSLQVV